MAARFPLIANSSANQIQELASGDDMDLTGSSITGAGIITATSFSGNATGLSGTPDITVDGITANDIQVSGSCTITVSYTHLTLPTICSV